MLTLKKTSVFVVAFVHSSSAFVLKMRYLVSAVENHCRALKAKAELEIDCKDPRKEDLKIFQKIQFFYIF